MIFKEAEAYLFSLGNEVSAMKLGLENIRVLLSALGDPQNKYLKVQVAGTNGKGSACAFLNSICLQAGIRTGLYTSPHLVSVTERFKFDGVDISMSRFAELASRVRQTAERLLSENTISYRPTFFEQMTAIGLLAFADSKVELAILETGLGGRLDATTAAKAEIAAITRIGLDHQQYLGDTIEKIAAEKAAIIQSGSKAVIGEQEPAAMRVILDRCNEVGVTPKVAVGGDLTYKLGLSGRHQIENAAVAILLANELREYFAIPDEAVADGLANAKHPGRLERIGHYLLDGAHNIDGAKALRVYLDEFVEEPITLVFGSMEDKDIRGIAEILFPAADRLILTRPANSRAASTKKIFEYAKNRSEVYLAENVARALEIAADFPDNLTCVTGSLYLVGEARNIVASRSVED